MYRYDQYDQQIVQERVAQFRDQVQRRIDNELTEDEFRILRLQNGLYMQRHAYMLRVAVPYGLLSSAQVRKFAQQTRIECCRANRISEPILSQLGSLLRIPRSAAPARLPAGPESELSVN